MPSLDHLRRLTDGRGVWQHARHAVPDRRHGYCLDDAARALWLCARLGGPADLATAYAGFVDHAWDARAGRFANFMTHDGRWLDPGAASDDAEARAFLALVEAAIGLPEGIAGWARDRASEAIASGLPTRHGSPRAWAWSLAAARRAEEAGLAMGHQGAELASRLAACWEESARADWPWFEAVLAYDAGRLAQGALDGAAWEPALEAVGLEALDWLGRIQTAPGGHLRLVGSEGYGQAGPPALHAQQPLDAWAMAEAAMSAHRLTGEARWRAEAVRARAWFLGENDAGSPLADPGTGACRDGIDPQGVSANRGAESTLAWLHTEVAVGRRDRSG